MMTKTLLLDNFGIRVNLVDLPTWPLYEYAHAEMYGSGPASRLWCMVIRPRIMPRRQARIERVMENAAAHIRQDLMDTQCAGPT